MKNLVYFLLTTLLFAAAGCKKDADVVQQLCDPTAKAVKTIANAEGIVYFNQLLQQAVISVHQPGTIDAVDVGVVCGSLPAALRADGTRVLVSGTFKEYGAAPLPSVPVGYTYYYLEVDEVKSR